uniref:Uncharacterized protein n=1 Tax=Arundo donax TaxID=35708 RepID=A0A0A9CYE2_ARUDO
MSGMWPWRPSEKPWPWWSSAATANPAAARWTAVSWTIQLDSPVKPCTTATAARTGASPRGTQRWVKMRSPRGLTKVEVECTTPWRA